jgi:hypothetical protein
MPTVAVIDGISVRFYNDEHPPPHFHVVAAEHQAVIRIDSCRSSWAICRSTNTKGHRLGKATKIRTARRMARMPARPGPRKDNVKPLPRIASCEPVIQGVLKIVRNDWFEGIVDLRPTIDRGRIFTYLREPENFRKVQVSEYGHSIGWINDAGEEIDFAADALRSKGENQAKLHKLAANMKL